MNPLLSIITLLTNLRVDLQTKFNAAMKKAEPLEQFEAGSAAKGILNEIDWARDRLVRTGEELEASLQNAGKFLSGFEQKVGENPELTAARFLEEFTKHVEGEALTAALNEKKVIAISDHENALTAAREEAATTAKTEAETEFNAKFDTLKLVTERREAAVTRVGAVAAARLTDEVLAGEGHEEAIAALEARNTKLAEANITAEGRPKFYADLIAKPDDESFTAGLELILEAAGGKLAAVAAPGKTPGAPKKGEDLVPINAGNPTKKTVI